MKIPDEFKNKMKQNVVTKYRALFSYPGGGFPKQPMSPRGQDRQRWACRRLTGEAVASRAAWGLILAPPLGYVTFDKFLNPSVPPLPNL